MLKILFSPSEGKNSGGDAVKKDIFGALSARDEILHTYNDIVLSKDEEAIKKLFGFKKFSECEPYICDIFNSPLMPAIERYQGVAYDYLKYKELNSDAQQFLQVNTLIFSNLYGPLLGGDPIANYKVKQGNTIGSIAPEKFYEVLDLRAGYYDKFYKSTKPYTTLKFLKNGKTVSHWAKAYRGIVLHEIAKHNIESMEAFMQLEIEGLSIAEIKVIKNKTEIVYNIVE